MSNVSVSEPAVRATNGIAYLEAGTGPDTILLLHGWAASKEAWRATLTALAPFARVIAPDLPGHAGVSLRGPARMTLLAATMAGLCVALGIERATVVGHSMGGNVAVELALSYPHLVERLVLVNPALQGPEMPVYTRSYLYGIHGWALLRTAIVLANSANSLADRAPRAVGPRLTRAMRRYRGFTQHDPEVLRRLLSGLISNALVERLPGIQAPTTVIAGRFDPLVPVGLSRRVTARIPGGTLRVLKRAGHDPMYEQPDLFAHTLLEILGYSAT